MAFLGICKRILNRFLWCFLNSSVTSPTCLLLLSADNPHSRHFGLNLYHFGCFTAMKPSLPSADCAAVRAAATLPQSCLDYRKCKIAFVYSHAELKAGGGFKVQQPARMAESRRGCSERTGRIWARACLQAASEARPRMCCKTVVKQIGLVLLFASHDICFSLPPLPPLLPSRPLPSSLPLNGLFDAHAAILWHSPPCRGWRTRVRSR